MLHSPHPQTGHVIGWFSSVSFSGGSTRSTYVLNACPHSRHRASTSSCSIFSFSMDSPFAKNPAEADSAGFYSGCQKTFRYSNIFPTTMQPFIPQFRNSEHYHGKQCKLRTRLTRNGVNSKKARFDLNRAFWFLDIKI